MEPILQINNISFAYPDGTQALQNLSLALYPGEKLAVLGENGSGKSTLFLCLNAILRPQSGEIIWQQKPYLYDKKSLTALRQKVGIVFQDGQTQLFCPTVWQEALFAPINFGFTKQAAEAAAIASLAATGMDTLKHRPPQLLSYGQKKRAGIAAVIGVEPQVILFDEPTSGLDPAHGIEVEALMNSLAAKGSSVVLSTHDVNLAYAWADRVVILSCGGVAAQGAPEEVFQNSALLQANGLSTPGTLQIYRALTAGGLLAPSASAPRTPAALAALIQEAQ